LRALYIDQRMTTRDIGRRFGVRHITIRRWLAAHGIPRRSADRGLANRGIDPPTRADLQRMVHDEHLSYRAIAGRYGVDHTAVPAWLNRHDITAPTVWGTRRRGREVVLPTPEQLQAAYDGGASLTRIAKRHGVSASLIGELCREHGIEVRPGGWAGGRRWTCTDGHQARSDYERRVDDWLTSQSLAHEVEPPLPFDRRYRADFLVGGTYIEVWGVLNSSTYTARRQRKTRLYEEYGLPLVELPAWAFNRPTWHRRLATALL
jgi:hypothetical protein